MQGACLANNVDAIGWTNVASIRANFVIAYFLNLRYAAQCDVELDMLKLCSVLIRFDSFNFSNLFMCGCHCHALFKSQTIICDIDAT
jgi:hypothetical protein